MHQLAHLSRPRQWLLALLQTGIFAGVVGACFVAPFFDWRWFAAPILVVPFIAPLESFLLTPLYILSGRFRYYSPLMFTTGRSDGGLDLHVGTIFDYVMRLKCQERGLRAGRIVTADLLSGLMLICEDVERGRLPPSTELFATSYFFSDRTISRLGFELRRPPAAHVNNLLMASVSIALRLSFTRGRPVFPDLRRIRQATTTAGTLVSHKDKIDRLLQRLP